MMSSEERDDDREFIASESKASSHHIYTCDTQSTRLNKKSKHDSKTLPLFLTIKYFLIVSARASLTYVLILSHLRIFCFQKDIQTQSVPTTSHTNFGTAVKNYAGNFFLLVLK